MYTSHLTSPPSEPDAVVTRGVVFEQLQDVEFIVVVLEISLVEHGVPELPVLTEHVGLK